MITRLCVGGPLDNLSFGSRYPDGFVLVNRPAGQVRVYENVDGLWTAKPVDTLIKDPAEPKNIRRAMAEFTHDVVTYDPERMGSW